MDYNNEFKVIDSEEKAYFLGLMYADGCLSKRLNKGYITYQTKISLTDQSLIKQLHTIFPFFNIGGFDFSRYKSTWSEQFSLCKINKQLFIDLNDYGLLEKKSVENSKNLKFPLLKENLYRPFIRGFFDGDGSINISKKRPNLRRIEFCSSSKEFLTELKFLLEEFGINCPIFREKFNNISPLYALEWVNSQHVIDIKNFLYKDATIYLDRKKQKFDSFNIVDKKADNPICNCGGPTRKKGSRQMKKGLMLRFKCIKCGQSFSTEVQIKQGELLETPTLERQKEDNQQPSLSSNTFEGSTTNNRVLNGQ